MNQTMMCYVFYVAIFDDDDAAAEGRVAMLKMELCN